MVDQGEEPVKHDETSTTKPDDSSSDRKRQRPTDSDRWFLKVTQLKRPFTMDQVRKFLGSQAELEEDETAVWMNKTRQVAIAEYKTKNDVESAQEFVNGKVWPAGFGQVLTAEIVSLDEAEKVKGQESGRLNSVSTRGNQNDNEIANKRRRMTNLLLRDRGGKSTNKTGSVEQAFTETRPRLMYKPVEKSIVQERKERRAKLAAMAVRAKLAAKKVALAKKISTVTNALQQQEAN